MFSASTVHNYYVSAVVCPTLASRLIEDPKEYRDDGTDLFQRDEAHQHSVRLFVPTAGRLLFWYPRLELHFLRQRGTIDRRRSWTELMYRDTRAPVFTYYQHSQS
jgi:hypothetical protein